MIVLGKIKKGDCTFLLVKQSNEETEEIANLVGKCISKENNNCELFQNNILTVDTNARELWEFGFNEAIKYEETYTTTVSGKSSLEGARTRLQKELTFAVNFCYCECYNEKLNCLFTKCCDDNKPIIFEFLNNCNKFIRVEITLDEFTLQGFEKANCGHLVFKAKEIIQEFIQVSKVYKEYPTNTSKSNTITVCEECEGECYHMDIWNKTHEVCDFNSSNGKILFTAVDEVDYIDIVWNKQSYKLEQKIKPSDVLEIEQGNIYLNNQLIGTMSELSKGVIGTTTSNGKDCVSIRTPYKNGNFGVVEYEEIESCKYPIWGLF